MCKEGIVLTHKNKVGGENIEINEGRNQVFSAIYSCLHGDNTFVNLLLQTLSE